jgi:sulfonate transport system ATP-binding protein
VSTSSRASVRSAGASATAQDGIANTAYSVSFEGVGRDFQGEKKRGQPASATRVLRDVTLEVGAGEVLAILGPSGCG